MPHIKPKTAHAPRTAKDIETYLTEGGRSLDVRLYNCLKSDFAGRSWGEQMDFMRKINGGDRWAGRLRPVYKHYELSPDPKDNCSLDTLLKLADRWVREFFDNEETGDVYQVAVVAHDDNKNHILHAHIIVNYINMVKTTKGGRALRLDMDDARVVALNQELQNMGKELGLTPLSNKFTTTKKAVYQQGFKPTLDADKPSCTHHLFDPATGHRTIIDDALGSRGVSWKQAIKNVVTLSLATAKTEKQFIENLKAMGVRTGRSVQGDYLFYHPDKKDTHLLRGERLGKRYSAREIRRTFMTGGQESFHKNDPTYRKGIQKAAEGWWENPQNKKAFKSKSRIVALVESEEGSALKKVTDLDILAYTLSKQAHYVATLDMAGGYTLKDISIASTLHSKYHVRSYKGYGAALMRAKDDRERAAILYSLRIAEDNAMFTMPKEGIVLDCRHRQMQSAQTPQTKKPVHEMTRQEQKAFFAAAQKKKKAKEMTTKRDKQQDRSTQRQTATKQTQRRDKEK
jgi:hypothetical protein